MKKTIFTILLSLTLSVGFSQGSFQEKLSQAAVSIIDKEVKYVSEYVSIPYPNGDVPAKTGVCTDVVIRTYRKLGIDLQKEVHEDMKKHFSKYPKKWGLKKPDKNIDHRRVPNLQTFFQRHGKELPISQNSVDYKPGHIVTWMLPGNLPHIGIVSNMKSKDQKRYLIVHNMGAGQVAEDVLFVYKITGHYKYGK
ncbi:MAG: DUF1287 domain-containing protein [Bacteroidota bacterium]|nr:DUF1287 domain-containing protein [Bacteroidota bacterium]